MLCMRTIRIAVGREDVRCNLEVGMVDRTVQGLGMNSSQSKSGTASVDLDIFGRYQMVV